jgi:hypothetical protein
MSGGAEVLDAMQKHIETPPQPVLDAWDPEALLDTAAIDDSEALLEGPLFEVPQALHEAVRDLPPHMLQPRLRKVCKLAGSCLYPCWSSWDSQSYAPTCCMKTEILHRARGDSVRSIAFTLAGRNFRVSRGAI